MHVADGGHQGGGASSGERASGGGPVVVELAAPGLVSPGVRTTARAQRETCGLRVKGRPERGRRSHWGKGGSALAREEKGVPIHSSMKIRPSATALQRR